MWNFLLAFLSARVTGIGGLVRSLLLVILLGALITGFIYAFVVFHAAIQRSHIPHVHADSTD